MQLQNVKKKRFNRIQHEGQIYRKTDRPVMGGIAECIKDEYHSKTYLTCGAYYKIGDHIFKDGESTSLIGDDNEPCGLHASFSGSKFNYYH